MPAGPASATPQGPPGLPLAGRRIVVTRSRAQAPNFAARLTRFGAEVLYVPTIRVEAMEDQTPLIAAISTLREFDWIIFTSVNGVIHFLDACSRAGVWAPGDRLGRARLCAIGPVTAQALQERGLEPDLLPDQYIAESLGEAFRKVGGVAGARVLLPRAEVGRPVIPRVLSEMGARVEDLAVYRTIAESTAGAVSSQDLADGRVDVVTFASGSAARNFASHVSPTIGESRVASIGPATSEVIRELGWTVTIEASVHTLEGLCDAIIAYYTPEASSAQ